MYATVCVADDELGQFNSLHFIFHFMTVVRAQAQWRPCSKLFFGALH